MKVLVTGGAGFIGSRLAARLLDEGFAVDVADDLSTGRRENVPDGAHLLECDLGEPASLDLLEPPYEAVLHLAGQSSGEKSFDDPVRDFDANARSTALLAGWALRRGVPALVHASSMGVYGQTDGTPVAETAPAAPVSWYGASKLAAETVLEAAGRLGLRTCSLRMFSVYGPGQDLDELRQGMVSIFLAYLLAGEPVLVRGPLDRVRDFVYVDDVVEAWVLALRGGVHGAVNVGTGTGTTIVDLIALLREECGLPESHPIAPGAPTPGDQRTMVADVAHARRALGWEPSVELGDGVAMLVAWARKERTWQT